MKDGAFEADLTGWSGLPAGTYWLKAYAQGGGTSTISGTVVDSDGGVVPGATVVVKDVATGTTYTDVTNGSGAFAVPALVAGTYTITVSLQGFKTAVIENVRVAPGTPATVQAVLTLGALQETVTVTSSSELINTQTATVASTLAEWESGRGKPPIGCPIELDRAQNG